MKTCNIILICVICMILWCLFYNLSRPRNMKRIEKFESTSGRKLRSIGYWENWKGPWNINSDWKTHEPNYEQFKTALQNLLTDDHIKHCTHVCYAFLTLSPSPNPDLIPTAEWDSSGLYGLNKGLVVTPGGIPKPSTSNSNGLDYYHVKGFVDIVQQFGVKAIISIGGWSDTSGTPTTDAQINDLVACCKFLHESVKCDGFDFDWEHLSEPKSDTALRKKRLNALYHIMKKLKDSNLKNKDGNPIEIGYTSRFNAFKGFSDFASNAEAKDLLETPGKVTVNNLPCDYINIMTIDTACTDLKSINCKGAEHFPIEAWKEFLDSYSLVNGSPAALTKIKQNLFFKFEPDPQPAGGKHPPENIVDDVIDYVKKNDFGGIFSWALNDGARGGAKGREVVEIHKKFMQH